MTERTLMVEMTTEMAKTLLNSLDMTILGGAEHTLERKRRVRDAMQETVKCLTLMEKATALYEDEDIVLMEHPALGDEAAVMSYIKADKGFQEDTGEYDADEGTARMLLEDHRAAFRKF